MIDLDNGLISKFVINFCKKKKIQTLFIYEPTLLKKNLSDTFYLILNQMYVKFKEIGYLLHEQNFNDS